ncbi:MAG TPA: SPOR domain-containing protein [Gammaproteobacteria bacterium]|nr:SPOR domain-containing protein [Gammaproteobacteria bacterium]
MRNLFFLLVLVNLGFAAWHAWYSHAPRPARTSDADLPRLTLVSEVPPDIANLRETSAAAPSVQLPGDAAAPAAAPSQPPAGGPPRAGAAARSTPPGTAAAHCTTVGPFRELAQAATAAATLRTAGYEPTQRVAEGDVWIGYWVYIDAIPSEAEANAILAKVRAEGITDSYVIPNSDNGTLVSLGVFSEIGGVARRREQVRSLGYDPKVVDRTRRATVFWVDVALTDDQTLDFDALQTPGRIQRLEQRSCEAPAR